MMTKENKNILFSLLTFSFIFSPFISIASINIPIPYIINAILMIAYIYLLFKSKKISVNILKILALMGCYIFYFLIVSIYNNYYDTELSTLYFFGFINILNAYIIANLYIENYQLDAGLKIIEHVFYACSIHALIMLLAFLMPDFSRILYSFVILNDTGEEFIELGVRSPGLTNSGGDHLSMIQAIGFICGYQLLLNYKLNLKKVILYVLCFVLLIISIMLSARSGYILLFIGCIYLTYKQASARIWNLKINKKLVYVTSATIIIALTSFILIYYLLEKSEYSRLFNRAFEFILNYQQTGSFSTNSTDAMSSMYFLPSSEYHLLFGSADFGRNINTNGFLHSDIGYVRLIYGSGLIGILLIALPFILIYYQARKIKFEPLSLITIAILIVIAIFNFKVLHLYGSRQSFKVLFIFYFILINKTYSMRQNEK